MKIWHILIRVWPVVLAGMMLPPTALAGGLDEYEKAVTAEGAGDFKTAVHYFTRAIEAGDLSKDSLSDAYFNRGLTHGRLDNLEAALSDYRDAVTLNPRHVEALSSICYELIQLNQLEQALHNCNKAVKLKPDHAPNYTIRAQIWLKKGRHGDAEKDYNRAIELESDNWILYFNRGFFYADIGRKQDARNSYRQAFDRAPDWARYQFQTSANVFRKYGFIQ